MAFEIVLTKRARNDLESLDRFTQKRIVEKLHFYVQNPLIYAEKLIDSSIGDYRFRIGAFRVIFDLEKNKIIILRIGHRREIYR